MKTLQRGQSVRFDAAVSGAVRTGVWDQWTSWGKKIKDGAETVFDEGTLSQAIANFANQSNDLYMDYDHQTAYVAENGQPAIALAWYCALAAVRDGQVFAFESHRDGIEPPDAAKLPDGLYGYRDEVTDAGQQLLGGGKYRYLSPMFDPNGLDELGNDIGYTFYCVAATNNPFQDGVEISFRKTMAANALTYVCCNVCGKNVRTDRTGTLPRHTGVPSAGTAYQRCRASGTKDYTLPTEPSGDAGSGLIKSAYQKGAAGAARKTNMIKMDDSGFYKRLGLDDEATPDQAMAAMKAYLKKMDDDAAMAQKMKDDDGDDDDKPSDGQSMKKMDDDVAMDDDAAMKKMDDATPEGIMADDADDAKKMDDDAAMKKMAKDLGCAPKLSAIAEAIKVMKLSHAPKTAVAQLSREVAELRGRLAKQDAAKKLDEATKFAKKAIAEGRWNPDEEKDLIEARVDNPKLAEKALSPKGTWTVLQRFTKQGDVLGKTSEPREDFTIQPGESVEDQDKLVQAAVQSYMKEYKVDYATALTRSPEAARLYRRAAR